MADADIRKTVPKPDKKDVTNEPVISSGDSVNSPSDSASLEASGGTVAEDLEKSDGTTADESEVDETAPVLAVVPGDVADSHDDIHPTGNSPDAVQYPVTGPRLPGIYLDDVEKYQDEVKSAVVEGRAPDDALNPFTGEGKDVTSDHSPAAQAVKWDSSSVNAH